MSTEFVKQTLRENLTRVLVPHVADGLWSIYDNAKTACERNKQPDQILRTFQNLLTRVPQWSDEILTAEVSRIEKASKCDYIEDLLLGVFVSYIRAFASLQQVDTSHVEIPFERPSVHKFIHTFYKSSARASWSAAYLFKTVGVTNEQQSRNRRDIEVMLANSLNEVIDGFIPWKDISKAYFRGPESLPPVPAPVPEPEKRPDTPMPPPEKPSIRFDEENEEVEFEADEEEERPKLQLGEDVDLGLSDDEEPASKPSGTMTLNL
jgi:hypothetical protein